MALPYRVYLQGTRLLAQHLDMDGAFFVYDSLMHATTLEEQSGSLAYDVRIFQALLKGFLELGQVERAVQLEEAIVALNVAHTSASYVQFIRALVALRDMSYAEALFNRMLTDESVVVPYDIYE